MSGGILVRARSWRSIVMCLSRCLCRVISLEIDGWDHWVVPSVNGVLGVDVVNKEDECK